MSDSELSEESEHEEVETVPPPKPYRVSDIITDLATHPTEDIVATADMNGYINVIKCKSGEEGTQSSKFRVSKRVCRCVKFNDDGTDIITLSKLGTMKITDCESSKVKFMNKDAHCAPPFVLKTLSQNLVASGDDDGTVRVWDLRQGKEPIIDEDRCADFISDIAVDSVKKLIFVSSGEGTLTTYNIRRRKFVIQSSNIEKDMTCVTVARGDTKVITGTSEGELYFYNWDEFAAPSDVFPVHESTLECIAPISNNVVCVGSGDGKIRALHVLPNRFVGVVGEHKDMCIDKIQCSHDNQYIATSAHGKLVKFWSVGHLCDKSFDPRDKMERSLQHTKLKETGIQEDKKDFMNDIENELVPPKAIDSSDEEDDNEDSSSNKDENDLNET